MPEPWLRRQLLHAIWHSGPGSRGSSWAVQGLGCVQAATGGCSQERVLLRRCQQELLPFLTKALAFAKRTTPHPSH